MGYQIVFQSRLVTANFALLLVVTQADVFLDVFLVFGLEFAEFALVGFFAAVLLHVFLEIVLEGGGVVADLAAEGLFRVVDAEDVLLEILELRRLEAAELAAEPAGRLEQLVLQLLRVVLAAVPLHDVHPQFGFVASLVVAQTAPHRLRRTVR